MGAIRKRGNVWYADLRVNGKRIRKRLGKSKRLAELALKDLEIKAERNQLGFLDRKNIKIEDFFTEFLKFSAINHRPSTTKRYKSAIKNFSDFLANERQPFQYLRDVSPEFLEAYKTHRKTDTIAKNGKKTDLVRPTSLQRGAKSYTVNFELGTLRTMFNHAVKQRLLDENPMRHVNFLKTEDSERRRFLTDAECVRFLDACEPEYYPVFFVLLNTGMRKGEVDNLEWKDINFESATIKIQRKSFWLPKTGEREIPASSEVMDVLNRLPKTSRFVFPDKEGERLNPNYLRRQLVRIAQNASIYDLTSVHSLRHTFASRLLMRGVDIPTVQKLMGHSLVETTMLYAHQTPAHLRAAVERLNSALTQS